MPISLDPTLRLSIRLESDKPDGPAFNSRYPTVRQALAIRKAIDDAWAASGNASEAVILLDAVFAVVEGWTGFDVPFSRDAMLDHLTIMELYELAGRCVSDAQMSEVSRKNSVSPSALNAGGSAPTADPESARKEMPA